MKKTFSRIISAVSATVLSMTALICTAPADTASAASTKTLLVLGDSISAGYGLASGDYGYYDYVAEYGGYTVQNLAVSGADCSDLLALLEKDTTKQAVKNADLICMSIGANDILQPAKEYLKEFQQDNQGEEESITDMIKRLDKEGKLLSVITKLTGVLRPYINGVADRYGNVSEKGTKQYLPEIETAVRAINANVPVLIQTIYNPVESSVTTLDGEDLSGSYDDARKFAAGQINKINDQIMALESFETVDVYSKFTGAGWVYVNTAKKDIHPSPIGHALIGAQMMQQLGIKTTKCERIFNLLKGLSAANFSAVDGDDYRTLIRYSPYRFGDVDNNGSVDATDATTVLKTYVQNMMGKKTSFTAVQTVCASIHRKSSFDAADATSILKFYVRGFSNTNISWGEVM